MAEQMRDAVISQMLVRAKTDKRIVFLTADMGAPALDAWRRELPEQYIDVGIAEQCLASVAAGMAKAGKLPFIYAIAPFVVSRIHEFHKVNAGIQNLSYGTIAVGAGFGYGDSGPTHHNTEDIALMRVVPNMTIYSPSDSIMAEAIADDMCDLRGPVYLRLERGKSVSGMEPTNVHEGYRMAGGSHVCIVATGVMVNTAMAVRELARAQGVSVAVIDAFRLKPFPTDILRCLAGFERVVTLEEHLLAGGLSSILVEHMADSSMWPERIIRLGVRDKLLYLYGRDHIHRELGLDAAAVLKTVLFERPEWPAEGFEA